MSSYSVKPELDKIRNFWVVAKYWKPEIRKSLKLIKYDWTILLSVWLLGAGLCRRKTAINEAIVFL